MKTPEAAQGALTAARRDDAPLKLHAANGEEDDDVASPNCSSPTASHLDSEPLSAPSSPTRDVAVAGADAAGSQPRVFSPSVAPSLGSGEALAEDGGNVAEAPVAGALPCGASAPAPDAAATPSGVDASAPTNIPEAWPEAAEFADREGSSSPTAAGSPEHTEEAPPAGRPASDPLSSVACAAVASPADSASVAEAASTPSSALDLFPASSASAAAAMPARRLSPAAAKAGVNMSDALPEELRPDILLHSPAEVVREYVAQHFAHVAAGKPDDDAVSSSAEEEEEAGEDDSSEDEEPEGRAARPEDGAGDGEREGYVATPPADATPALTERDRHQEEAEDARNDKEKDAALDEAANDGNAACGSENENSDLGDDSGGGPGETDAAVRRREMAMKAKRSTRRGHVRRREGGDKHRKKRRKSGSEEKTRVHPVNSLSLGCRRVKLYEVDDTGRWIDKGTGHFYVTDGRGTAAVESGEARETATRLSVGAEEDELETSQRDAEDESGLARLVVEDEENGRVYVNTAIAKNYAYQHQKDSIITWQEGQTGDLYRALSFQHPHGCFACWTYLTLKAPDRCAGSTEDEEEEEEGEEATSLGSEEDCRRMRAQSARSTLGLRPEEAREEREDDEEDEAGIDPLVVGLDGADVIPHHILETPNEENLHMLMTRMEFDLPHPQTGELVLLDVLGRHWLYLLFAFMRKCIAAEKIEQLKQIAFIVRKMLVFWSGHIDALEVLLSDEFWPDVLKSLEYDQDLLHQGMEMRHSEFFGQRAQFHNVIQLEDPVFTSHVHLHYRLMYLKDVAITRYLDEAAINRLQSVLACNIQEVLRLLLRDCPSPPGCPSSPSSFYGSHGLLGFHAQPDSNSSSSCFAVLRERLREDFFAALFLRELLQNLAKLLQQQMLEKHSIFTQIKQHMILLELRGYLDGTAPAVGNWNRHFLPLNRKAEEYQERLKEILLTDGSESYRPNPLDLSGLPYPDPVCVATEILNTFAEIQPQLLRQAFFSEAKNDAKQESRLLLLLAETLETCDSDSVQVQVKEILIKVVCSPVMELPEKDEIHMLFYDKGVMDRLLHTLFLPLNAEEMSPNDFHRLHHAKQQILEILAHCVPAHKHRFKIRIQKDRVPIRAVLAALRPTFDKFLALFAVKFIRACISLKDTYVDKHLVQYKVMRPIIWMLKEEQHSISLFSSRRQHSSMLGSVVLDCLRALGAGATSFASPQSPSHSLHIIEFLFTDDFCRHWIGDIQKEMMKNPGRRPCQILQDLHDLYVQFVAKPPLSLSQSLHLRSPQDCLSPSSSRVLSPKGGLGGRVGRDLFAGSAGDGDENGRAPARTLRSSLGRVIRRDPNRSLEDEEEESWFLSDDREDEDDEVASPPADARECSSVSPRNSPDSDDEESSMNRRSHTPRSSSSLVDGYDDEDNEDDEDDDQSPPSSPPSASRKPPAALSPAVLLDAPREGEPGDDEEDDDDDTSFLLKAFPEKSQSPPTRKRQELRPLKVDEETRSEKSASEATTAASSKEEAGFAAKKEDAFAFFESRSAGGDHDQATEARPFLSSPRSTGAASPSKGTSPGRPASGPKKIAVKLKLGGSAAGASSSSPTASAECRSGEATGPETEAAGDSCEENATRAEGRIPAKGEADRRRSAGSSGDADGLKDADDMEDGEKGSELLAGMRLLSGALKRKPPGLSPSLSASPSSEQSDAAWTSPRAAGREGLLAPRNLWGAGTVEAEDANGGLSEESSASTGAPGGSREEERKRKSWRESGAGEARGDPEPDGKKPKWSDELVADMLRDDSDEEDT
ncbi:hypothetical protein BESB_032680 [Besnoitia besnoiti]|uniref:Uncharacterized protein n=1 Tax=Besnoitia besnoiti TaxID=94643 RepID=A0A2A9M437_BESBE|nr:uncharacterized protein BESB_032680 [Besnoitia besnoiti]PFH31071.1 hypothetical protein BESB_032680 [Besnoitia besnoiti]